MAPSTTRTPQTTPRRSDLCIVHAWSQGPTSQQSSRQSLSREASRQSLGEELDHTRSLPTTNEEPRFFASCCEVITADHREKRVRTAFTPTQQVALLKTRRVFPSALGGEWYVGDWTGNSADEECGFA